MARSRNGQMWATLSSHTIAVWSTRPAQVVAALTRTKRSIDEYGANQRIEWRPDGRALLVQTDKSFLLLYLLVFPSPPSAIYSYIPASGSGSKSRSGELLAPGPTSLRNSFAPGAGESAAAGDTGLGGLAGDACELRFRLVLRIDAGLRCATSIETHMLVSTINPPAIQCIRWPEDDPNTSTRNDPSSRTHTTLISKLGWIAQTPDQHVLVDQIIYSRPMDVFVLVTSDGRAYTANLDLGPEAAVWNGNCFHAGPARRRRSSAADPGRTRSLLPEALKNHGDESAAEDSGLDRDKDAVETDGGRVKEQESGKGKGFAPVESVPDERRCTVISINAKFSLIAVGQPDGTISVYTYRAPGRTPLFSHSLSVRQALKSTASYLNTGSVLALSWTSDGYGLAAGWDKGVAMWSTYGKLMGCSLREDWETASKHFSDSFMFGASDLFWGPGNTELFVLAKPQSGKPLDMDNLLFILPFAKSAVAGQHSPDNTRYAFFQTDDSVHVYRGADQPDLSVITPESDVWQHIKIPQSYLAANWPIRYASISSDGKLIAIAGRRGLAHFSSSSGRWKTHKNVAQEQSFAVRGGLQWFEHVLIAACDSNGEYQLRLYSRDLELDSTQLLDLQLLPSPVILTSLFDNSLLVYTADNTFYHFLIDLADDLIRLRLCGSITFEGVVGEPARVRGMSWMIPPSQQRFGNPVDDLTVATIIFLIDGKLVLLRPRKSSDDQDEVAYDMQILADRIEYYWTHLQGIGTLENSLWGYDGTGIKLWLDALTIEAADDDVRGATSGKGDGIDGEGEEADEYKTIEESVRMPLDFYPLCVLLEKGIVIGVECEVSLRRSLDFAIFRTTTNTHLFLHQILRNYLEHEQLEEAVFFATYYEELVYFGHALEILLHAVLEDEADAGLGDVEYLRAGRGKVLSRERSTAALLADVSEREREAAQATADAVASAPRATLPLVVTFLDHFPHALQAVVGCARKTEVARWGYLFEVVGPPIDLFEKCLAAGELRTAAMYLLVLHNLEAVDASIAHTVRLLRLALDAEDFSLARDLVRFCRSMDEDGDVLRRVADAAGLTQPSAAPATLTARPDVMHRSTSAPALLDIEEEEDDDEEQDESQPPVPEVAVNGRVMPSRGVGMSLSRVGLRSATSLWTPSWNRSPSPSPSPSPSEPRPQSR